MMKFLQPLILSIVVIGLTGCEQSTEEAPNLDQAVQSMEQADPSPPPAAPNPTQSAGAPVSPSQELNQAMTAYKTGSYEDAVTRLYQLRARPGMTVEQAMAAQDAVAGVMNELYALAAQGDVRAQRAVEQYRRMQMGGR